MQRTSVEFCGPAGTRRVPAPRRAFTLVELLIVVVLLGIAGAMVIPAMGQTGILRVQAAVRTVVSDITFAQSDAVAFQERRALVFNIDEDEYRVVSVPGTDIDPGVDTMFHPSKPGGLYVVRFDGEEFGDSRITQVDFAGEEVLIFDPLGGPIDEPTDNTPGVGGTITLIGSGAVFEIDVEPFTGRVTVERADGGG